MGPQSMTLDCNQLLSLTADMGCRLMASGAEIYRVEESMQRLLKAYGMEGAEVFAIPSCIIVSATAPGGEAITRMQRIGAHGTDLELLERCNELCRRLCSETPPPEEARRMLGEITAGRRTFSAGLNLLGYGISPAFFAPLFGGDVRDMFCALLTGLLVGLTQIYGGRLIGSNSFFRTAVSSAAASLFSIALVKIGLGSSIDTITISALMMLVPGVAVTNAMREIMAGDTISALSHTADAILIGVAIALGSAVGIAVMRSF